MNNSRLVPPAEVVSTGKGGAVGRPWYFARPFHRTTWWCLSSGYCTGFRQCRARLARPAPLLRSYLDKRCRCNRQGGSLRPQRRGRWGTTRVEDGRQDRKMAQHRSMVLENTVHVSAGASYIRQISSSSFCCRRRCTIHEKEGVSPRHRMRVAPSREQLGTAHVTGRGRPARAASGGRSQARARGRQRGGGGDWVRELSEGGAGGGRALAKEVERRVVDAEG